MPSKMHQSLNKQSLSTHREAVESSGHYHGKTKDFIEDSCDNGPGKTVENSCQIPTVHLLTVLMLLKDWSVFQRQHRIFISDSPVLPLLIPN